MHYFHFAGKKMPETSFSPQSKPIQVDTIQVDVIPVDGEMFGIFSTIRIVDCLRNVMLRDLLRHRIILIFFTHCQELAESFTLFYYEYENGKHGIYVGIQHMNFSLNEISRRWKIRKLASIVRDNPYVGMEHPNQKCFCFQISNINTKNTNVIPPIVAVWSRAGPTKYMLKINLHVSYSVSTEDLWNRHKKIDKHQNYELQMVKFLIPK